MGKSIALFGTSADPPTIGHKKILEELSKIYAFTIGYVSNNPNNCLLYTSPSPRD